MIVFPIRVLCTLNDTIVAYKHGSLYAYDCTSTYELKNKRRICKIPISPLQRIFSHISLYERLFRMVPRASIVLSKSSFLFACRGAVFFVDIENQTIEKEYIFDRPMNAPLTFSRIQGIAGFSDCIVCGEYHGNLEKREMRVLARTQSGKWETIYSFPKGTISHIHGFCPDPERNRVLILTGDSDSESGIYAATDNFALVTPLLQGSQQTRSCVAFSHSGGILYATDSPLSANNLYVLHSGVAPTAIANMPGPIIYATKAHDGAYWFATSVEPDSRLTRLRYLLSYKLGNGVSDRFVHIFTGTPEDGFKEVLKFKKDIFPMALFQFGNAQLQPFRNGVLITPQSVCRYNGKTIYHEGR